MEERKKGESGGDVKKAIQEVKMLKQGITMMKDTLASDLTALEGTMPHGQEIEGRLMELDGPH
eukprot:9249883-Prorocentrum_lima.AAC.1